MPAAEAWSMEQKINKIYYKIDIRNDTVQPVQALMLFDDSFLNRASSGTLQSCVRAQGERSVGATAQS